MPSITNEYKNQPGLLAAVDEAQIMSHEGVLLGGLSHSAVRSHGMAVNDPPGFVLSSLVSEEAFDHVAPRQRAQQTGVSRKAFALSPATALHWACGLSLTATLRKGGSHDKMVDATGWQCSWCSKWGHEYKSCPLRWTDGPRPEFVETLLRSDRVSTEMLVGQPLEGVQKTLELWAAKWNRNNPFLSEPDVPMWRLPKRLGAWKAIGCSSLELSWIGCGFQLRFLSDQVRARALVHRLIARAEAGLTVTPRELGGVAGLLISFNLAVKPARLYTRALYKCIGSGRWDQQVHVSHEALSELRFWRRCLPMFNGRTMIRHEASRFLFTDVGDVAWGAHVMKEKAHGWLPWGLQGPDTSSTHRELLALLYALLTPSIANKLQNTRTMFAMDNQSAVYCINHGGSRTAALSMVCKQIWTACIRWNIQAEAVWLPREMNSLADGLSKAVDLAAWRLAPEQFERLERLFGPHTIDRCADSANALCKRFNSKYFDPCAEAVNCFTQDWSQDNNFVNPNFDSIAKILDHAASCQAQLTLVFPVWERQPWLNKLRKLASKIVQLPPHGQSFLPPLGIAPNMCTRPNWQIAAARLDLRRH